MNWFRAKNIILLLMIALNIFLLTYIIAYANSWGVSNETIQTAEKILSGRGINLECEIPTYCSDTQRLKYGKSENKKSFTYDVHIDAKEKAIRKFLNSKGIVNSSYILDGTSNNQNGSIVFNFIQKYKGFPVFDSYIKVTLTNKDQVFLELSRKQIKGFSVDKTGDIAAAYQILLGNFDGSRQVTIADIDIGYKDTDIQERDNIEYMEQPPVWRIKIKGLDEPAYFRTSDGKEIK